MSINVSNKIIIKSNNPKKLEKELIIKKEKLNYINYDNISNTVDDTIKEFPIDYELTKDAIIIYICGNKLFYPIDVFFQKYKENVICSVSDEFDSPYETGLPFYNSTYIYYKNGKKYTETETDKVIRKIKSMIKNNENLYDYLYGLFEIYHFDESYSKDFFNNEYSINENSIYDDLLVNLSRKFPNLFSCVSKEKKNNYNIVLESINKNAKVYFYIPRDWQKDETMISIILKSDIFSLSLTNKEKKRISTNIQEVLKVNSNYLKTLLIDNPSLYTILKYNFIKYTKNKKVQLLDKYLDVYSCKMIIKKEPQIFSELGNIYKENLEIAKLYFKLFVDRKLSGHTIFDMGIFSKEYYKRQDNMNFDDAKNIKDLYLYILNYDCVPMQKEIIVCMTPKLLKDKEIVLLLFKIKGYKYPSCISTILNGNKKLINKSLIKKLFEIDLNLYNYMTPELQANGIIKEIYLKCGGKIKNKEEIEEKNLDFNYDWIDDDELPF